MAKGLEGKKIVFGGTRKIEEISTIIEKQGGIPVVRSLQGTVFLAEKEVAPDLQSFIETGADWIVFTTGIGLETLITMAEKLAVKEEFLKIIRHANVASRGYKTLGALKKLEVNPVAVDEDGTTSGLTRALEEYDFQGKRVMIQLHGETAPALTKFFEDRGASVLKILPYQHIAPEEETVSTLCKEIIHNEVDAVCFTTAIQVRSLFQFAREKEIHSDILKAFSTNIMAAAVGKVTAEALREVGLSRYISPELERMGSMIVELASFYDKEK
jgi:uroporphyrinogen-III synthase